MKRQELEKQMRLKGVKNIDLIMNESDRLAISCHLTAAALLDYNDRRIDRKVDIWGYLFWKDGKSYRIAFKRN